MDAASGESTAEEDSSTTCSTPLSAAGRREGFGENWIGVEEDLPHVFQRGGKGFGIIAERDGLDPGRQVERGRVLAGGSDRKAPGVQAFQDGAADLAAGAGDEDGHGCSDRAKICAYGRMQSQLDGRRAVLELSPQGLEFMRGFREQQRAAYEYITAEWSEADRLAFARLMLRYVDAIDNLKNRRPAPES
nr:hypothetical protein [Nocardia seriolae]